MSEVVSTGKNGRKKLKGAKKASSRRRRLELFHEPYRQHIASLTCCSDALEDLVKSFPALLFALTSDYGTSRRRTKTVRLINDGAPLKHIADTLGLPWWLRKIPAEALTKPFGDLPDGPEFNRQIVNLIPKTETEARFWLRRVLYAYHACDEEYALWMARHKRFPFRDRAQDPHVLLGAWAWFSTNQSTGGFKLLRKGWTAKISMIRAYDEARAWERRLRLAAALGNGLRDTWFEGGTVHGYEFVALRTVEDFLEESRVMGNCLDQYGDQVTRENVRVFSMRKSGKHMADVEIGFHEDDPAMPMIEQLRGPKNRRAAPKLWQAAYAWLGSQTFRPIVEGVQGGDEIGKEIISSVWMPYLMSLTDAEQKELVGEFAFGKRPNRIAVNLESFNEAID